MELIVPESGEIPAIEGMEPTEQAVDSVDETLNSFEKAEETSEPAEEQPEVAEQVPELEPQEEPAIQSQELDVPLEIKEEETEEPPVPEIETPDALEEPPEVLEKQEPGGFEELKLEESSEEKEEESEQDLDSLINDLLKEESVSEEDGGGPKILDEAEMAQWAEDDITPEQPLPTADMEEKSEEIDQDQAKDKPEEQPEDQPVEMVAPEPEMDVKLEEEVVAEETLELPTEEQMAPELEDKEEVVAEDAAPEVPEPATEPDAQGQKTILVVDDSIVIRKMVEIALENESYNVISVGTGKEAFSYLDSKDPDLVILDIMLPDVNGLDILKAIKAKTTIPVVMLSAKDTPKETSQAKELGADDFIPKPFRDEELVGKIHELIGQ
jgi:CheY-like chemotaxis protein